MTNPAHSVFTVTVKFKDIFYDVEIKPTLNGQPIEWIQDRVDQWNSAESTHKLFSQTIVKMLDKTNVSADSLETLGVVTCVDGFSFDALESQEATQVVWEEFISYLQDPVSAIAGRDPVAEEVLSSGPGAGITLTNNVYLNLGPDEQKAVRLSLFQKKCYQHFALAKRVRLGRIAESTPEEKACLNHLVYSNPFGPKLTPGAEISRIFFWEKRSKNEKTGTHIVETLSEKERKAMASSYTRIKEEIKQAARQPIAEASHFVLELDSSEEENVRADRRRQQNAAQNASESDVETLTDSSEERVPKFNVLRISQDISIDHEEEDLFVESNMRSDVLYLSDDDTFSFSESFPEFNK